MPPHAKGLAGAGDEMGLLEWEEPTAPGEVKCTDAVVTPWNTGTVLGISQYVLGKDSLKEIDKLSHVTLLTSQVSRGGGTEGGCASEHALEVTFLSRMNGW